MTFLLRITYANLLYALLWRVRGPVYAWEIRLPKFLAAYFAMLRPYKLFDRDEWILLHEQAFDAWRDQVLPALIRGRPFVERCDGVEVDFRLNMLQQFGRDFERLFVFVGIVREVARGAKARVVMPWIGVAVDPAVMQDQFRGIAFQFSLLNDLGERLYEWSLSAAHLARTLAQGLRSFAFPRIAVGSRRVLWTGISPQEIPAKPDKLHFGWAAAYGSIPPGDVLYVLPVRPTEASARFLDSQGIAAISEADLPRLLSPLTRFRTLASSCRGFLRGLFIDSATIGPLRARFMARVPLWLAVGRDLKSELYVTSYSASWPERPEAAALQGAGLRTVIWCYSTNVQWIAKSARNFRDVGVPRSVTVSGEIWVWNHAVRRYLERRRASQAVPAPHIKVTGAMMCGNASFFNMTQSDARSKLGLEGNGFYISVFDVPTVNDAWRDRFGGGPVTIELSFSQAFFEGLKALLVRAPEVRLILKLKRELNAQERRFPKVLYELIAPDSPWMRDGRIHVADVDCDPWLPVTASDACIGVPCTSPVLIAIASGRPAAFFDPLGVIGQTPEGALRVLALRTQEELEVTVDRWLAGEGAVRNPVPELAIGPEWRADQHLFDSGGRNLR